MTTLLAVIGAVGGTGLFTGIAWLIRTGIGIITSNKENTKATNTNTDKLERLTELVNQHTLDIAVLKDRTGIR